ncbi:coiled-coil domain-containing protein 187 isoform X2 [Genypterus blacodes]|uniref:coiled-coil domain-containing protein 187 isoform X2 n=1 Tax=Genypterus blacodes TaxID=154954 RepID=UPI003F75CFCB
MAELEIDQSNLPRVQEVEHYYTNNIQKNQLVQNDIRIAKRLQDEEQEEQAQQSALFRQNSRQLEEQDFKYARVIQEEIQRCAEEAQRREQDDEEMAKRMQEEEQQRRRRRSSTAQEGFPEGSSGAPALPASLSSLPGEEQHSSTASRWQCSTSLSRLDLTEPQSESPRGPAAQGNTSPRSNEGHTDSIRHVRDGLREPLSEDSDDSDAVFSSQLSAWSQRLFKRENAEPPRRCTSLYQPKERNHRGPPSHSSFTGELRSCEGERGERREDRDQYGDPGERRVRQSVVERSPRDQQEDLQRNRQDPDWRSAEVRDRRRSRSESVRLHEADRHSVRGLARTWTCRENPDKHVRFQEGSGSSNGQQPPSRGVWEMLGQVLRERGVPVRFGVPGAPLQVGLPGKDSQVQHGSEVSHGDPQPQHAVFQRAASSRHSFHGDMRDRGPLSYEQNGEREHRADRHCDVPPTLRDDGEVWRMQRRDPCVADRERRGSGRWRQRQEYGEEEERAANPDYSRHSRSTRTTSQRRHNRPEEQFSSEEEEEEEERRVAQPRRRFPQRSQSLRVPSRRRWRPAGSPPQQQQQPKPEGASLDMGELQQVLEDEELARRLQEEEEKRSRKSLSSQSSQPSSRRSYPDGDFRAAQVAQDEEIARFMQKQEIKTKRRSRELEGPASWREHRAMMSQHDRRAARDRQVQRERLDSEGLPSPTEDGSPDNLPPSPVSTLPQQAQQIRNIAEELDPTFQSRRQGTESLRGPQTGPGRQSPPPPNAEEPTFIPPTKRQTDKPARTKPKEKKENCKQQ